MENKITDKGWAAMRTLLDREMPEKRRRRFAWWWFALLLLPLAMFGSRNWWETPPPPPAPPTQIYAERSIPNPNISHTATRVEPKEKSTTSVGQRTRPQTPLLQQHQKTPHFAQNSIITKPSEPVVPTLATETPERTSLLPTTAPEPAPAAMPTLAIATPLSPLDIERADLASPNVPPVSMKEKPKHWAFGINTVLSTEQFNTVNGFATGVTVDWRFAKKFGLRTGLQYNIYEPQEQHRPVASVTSQAYTSNVDGNIIILDLQTGTELTSLSPHNSYGDSLSNNVFIPVNRLERLELPVTVFWQAAKPLKVFGGLSLKRTLSTKADRQNYSGDYILRLSDQVAEDGASKLSSSEFDRWSVDAMLGAGLQIGRIFELGLSAKMPLSELDFSSQKTASSGFGAFDVVKTPSISQNNLIFSLYGTMFF